VSTGRRVVASPEELLEALGFTRIEEARRATPLPDPAEDEPDDEIEDEQ
jgi:hypothetical protein